MVLLQFSCRIFSFIENLCNCIIKHLQEITLALQFSSPVRARVETEVFPRFLLELWRFFKVTSKSFEHKRTIKLESFNLYLHFCRVKTIKTQTNLINWRLLNMFIVLMIEFSTK